MVAKIIARKDSLSNGIKYELSIDDLFVCGWSSDDEIDQALKSSIQSDSMNNLVKSVQLWLAKWTRISSSAHLLSYISPILLLKFQETLVVCTFQCETDVDRAIKVGRRTFRVGYNNDSLVDFMDASGLDYEQYSASLGSAP